MEGQFLEQRDRRNITISETSPQQEEEDTVELDEDVPEPKNSTRNISTRNTRTRKPLSNKITRSQVRTISSNNPDSLRPKISVNIPQREADYYTSFQKVREENIGFIAYINNIKKTNQKPKNYKKALTGSKAVYWDTAMRKELNELEH